MSALRPNLERNLGFLLAEISRLVRQEYDRRVRDLGLTRAQWLFLHYLDRRPGCTQSELADLLQMQKITISRQARRLEKAGWIQRAAHTADRRAYQLELAPGAARIVTRLNERADQLREDYLRGLAPGRRRSLVADLTRIKANLRRLDARPRR